jgi:hypothetical protein
MKHGLPNLRFFAWQSASISIYLYYPQTMFDEDDDVFEHSGADELFDELDGDSGDWEPVHHGLTQEGYSEIFKNVHPTASQWKDTEARNDDIFVTVGEGTQVMWRQGKVEMEFVKKKIEMILGTDSPKMIDLFNLLFGPRSRMGRLMEEKLEISSEKLSEHLGLFFLTAAYNLSKTQFFSKQSMVDVDGLSSENDYQIFWNSIAECGVLTGKASRDVANAARNRGVKPLWIDIQNAFNDTCRELFVESFPNFMRIILDDDKMHDSSKNPGICGLKKSLHVRDNRTGCVAHTLVYTASGLPIGIEWEPSGDDSTTSATERLIRSQLAPMHGNMGPPNLTNTALCMDRGYINPRLLYDFIVLSGAEIMGTCKRQPMFPFTFEQHLKPTDPRHNGPVKGQKHFCLKILRFAASNYLHLLIGTVKVASPLELTLWFAAQIGILFLSIERIPYVTGHEIVVMKLYGFRRSTRKC